MFVSALIIAGYFAAACLCFLLLFLFITTFNEINYTIHQHDDMNHKEKSKRKSFAFRKSKK